MRLNRYRWSVCLISSIDSLSIFIELAGQYHLREPVSLHVIKNIMLRHEEL